MNFPDRHYQAVDIYNKCGHVRTSTKLDNED
jgi:hypothetical protein